MFGFAALVIHSVFRTSHRDVNINETSSYVDLAPLYGNSVEDQNRIRVRDGRGRLHPDVFAEDRLLLLPPQVCVLLVLFSRNHNVSPFTPYVTHPPQLLVSTLWNVFWKSTNEALMRILINFRPIFLLRKPSFWRRKKSFSRLPGSSIVAGLVQSSSLIISPAFWDS